MYKEKTIELNKNRKLINAVKKAGIKTMHPRGRWNGYGYEQLPLVAVITSLSEMRKFNKIQKEVQSATPSKPKTQEEIVSAWAKRLAKLTAISIEDAEEIAQEKLDYQQDRIAELEDRNCEHYSVQRQKLINKLERENPLRYIKNADHAYSILAASHRHNCTNYEQMLDYARELAEKGEIERSEVKEYARTHYYDFFQRNDS